MASRTIKLFVQVEHGISGLSFLFNCPPTLETVCLKVSVPVQ
jgi:hypothetical protein